MITVLFFGRFSDLSAEGPLQCEAVADLSALQAELTERFPGFEALTERAGSRVVINQAFVSGNPSLKPGDEVAFMSALSGG